MILYFYMLSEIEEDMLADLISVTNSMEEKDKLRIIMDCPGGIVQFSSIMTDIINEVDHEIYITAAYSSAFDLVYNTKGKLKIYDSTKGMIHGSSYSVEIKSTPGDGNVLKSIRKNQKLSLKKDKEMMKKLKVSKSKVKKFLRGEDVFFSSKEMRRMFKSRLI